MPWKDRVQDLSPDSGLWGRKLEDTAWDKTLPASPLLGSTVSGKQGEGRGCQEGREASRSFCKGRCRWLESLERWCTTVVPLAGPSEGSVQRFYLLVSSHLLLLPLLVKMCHIGNAPDLSGPTGRPTPALWVYGYAGRHDSESWAGGGGQEPPR